MNNEIITKWGSIIMPEISNILKEQADLLSEPFVRAAEMHCPYLGLKHDPLTVSGFPDPGNFCHRRKEAYPLEISVQSDLCLTGKYEACAIFQQGELPDETAGNPRSWQKKARPLALILPLILILIAALIWWPAPGASKQDATTNAASLQNVVKPAAEVQPAPVPERIDRAEAANSPQFEPTLALDAVNFQPQPTPDSPEQERTKASPGGFRVRIYE